MTYQEQWEAESAEIMTLVASASIDGLRATAKRVWEEIERRGNGAQVRTRVMPDSWYERLDAGIRFPVRVLHAFGLETAQSCQGGAGHDWHEPGIDLAGGRNADAFAALAAIARYGIDVTEVLLRWSVTDGLPEERHWRIVLRRAYPERATERPIFVYGCVPEMLAPAALTAKKHGDVDVDDDELMRETGRAYLRAQGTLPTPAREVSQREADRPSARPATA